jgi:Recombination endonuclease VII
MAEVIVLYDGPIVSRAEALSQNYARYFTGKPCRHGHIAERLICGHCSACQTGAARKSREAFRKRERARLREEQRKWREANRDKDRAASRRWGIAHRQERRAYMRAFRANLAREKERIAGRPRPSACEVCGSPGKIHFDHCHGCGRFRGWLCHRCNRTLGALRDDAALLRKLADYLDLHGNACGAALEPGTEQKGD